MASTRLNNTILKCAVCGILKPKYRCSNCKMTKYCSQNCQIKHWKSGHKQQCKKLKKSDNKNNMNGISSSKQSQETIKKQILSQYVKRCDSDDPQIQIEYTRKIRRLLSIERDPPIQSVIDSGIVPRLVQFLQFDKCHELQFEAAWCLTNIASGTTEHTTAIIKHGAVPILVQLLQSKYDIVKEQAIWALGNVAGDGPKYRDLALSHDVLSKMVSIWNANPVTQQQLILLRNATWTLSNFCRGKPSPDFKYFQLFIQALNIMIKSDDTEILQNTCWAFSYLSDVDINDTKQQIQAIINNGSLDRLIELLSHESAHVRHPALRTIGNICTGSDQQTDTMINLGVLQKLHHLIQHDRAPIKREACWVISNITAGSQQQIQSVMTCNIFPVLIDILRTEKYEIAKEALWAMSNATCGGSDKQIVYLVNNGAIEQLCKFLKKTLPEKITLVALEGIENILAVGKRSGDHKCNGYNKFAKYVKKYGGFDYLIKLQSDGTIGDKIYDKVTSMIKQYFNVNGCNTNNNKETTPNQMVGHKCNQCGASKSESRHLKMCKKCKSVFYCSKHCQKISWKRKHRFYCLS